MASDVQPPGPETAGMLLGAHLSPPDQVDVGYTLPDSSTFVVESRPLQQQEEDCDKTDMNSNAHTDNAAQQINKPYNVPLNRPPRKRRHSSSLPPPSNHNSAPKFSSPQQLKRRRKTTTGTVQSMKFLLGGNISDPLNLNSLVTGDPNAPVVSPYCSPAPRWNKDPIPVIIPKDITDPLNLNAASDEDDNTGIAVSASAKAPRSGGKKKKRHHSHRKKVGDQAKKDGSSDFTSDSSEVVEKGELSDRDVPTHLEISRQNQRIDKIVSPVLDAFDDTSPRARQRKRKEPSSKVSRSLLIKSDTAQTEQQGTHVKQKVQQSQSREQKSLPKFQSKGKLFQYGNYNQYYGKRNPEKELDNRLRCFSSDWFEGKEVLDIGCNIGHITISIAREFEPKRIVGIDIDGNLISIARKNVRHYLSPASSFLGDKFPMSENRCRGPIAAPPVPQSGMDQPSRFPNNVSFKCCNYVLERDELLALQKQEYDVILCLSVTKWIHLNWGDQGLKRMFKRMFLQLKPGGRLLLEPQTWQSYARKKKLTEKIHQNYREIKLKPEQFTKYLLSKEVGFSTCELVDTPVNPSKGFQRPIMMFRKSSRESSKKQATEQPPDEHRHGDSEKTERPGHHHHHHESSTSKKHGVATVTAHQEKTHRGKEVGEDSKKTEDTQA